jgi:hypothetical protein
LLRWGAPDRTEFFRGVKRTPYVAEIAKGFTGVHDSSRVGLLPVLMAQSADRAELRADAGSALGDLQDELQRGLAERWRLARVAWSDPPAEAPPEVYLGEIGGRLYPRSGGEPSRLMRFVVWDTYPGWKRALRDIAARDRFDYFALVSVGVGTIPTTTGAFASKLRVGTGNTVRLNSLGTVLGEGRADVVMLCAALMDANGEIVRVAAEGVAGPAPRLQPNPHLAIGMDLSDLLEHESLLQIRRDDLPGKPLAWEVAAEELRKQLLRGPGVARR